MPMATLPDLNRLWRALEPSRRALPLALLALFVAFCGTVPAYGIPARAPAKPVAVSAVRLQELRRGVYADNVVNNTRIASYEAVDIAKMKSMGFTYVSIPIDLNYLLTGVPIEGGTDISDARMVAGGLARLDSFVDKLHRAGFAVVLLVAPNRLVYKLPIATSQSMILQAEDLLATRYAGKYSPDSLFFDVLDEPHYDQATWNAFAPQIVTTLRKSAPLNTLIVQPGRGGHPEMLANFTPVADANVIYAVHIFVPARLVVQGNGAPKDLTYLFPAPDGGPTASSTGGVMWSYARMDAYIKVAADWGASHNLPIIMNAFGCPSLVDRQSRINWMTAVRQDSEKYGLGWGWWSYDSRSNGIRRHPKFQPTEGLYDPDLVKLLSYQASGVADRPR
jgi:Cellulase (glycosyl hydrolase family 5)